MDLLGVILFGDKLQKLQGVFLLGRALLIETVWYFVFSKTFQTCIFYYISPSRRHFKLLFFLIKDRDSFILHRRQQGYWWPGNTRSQDICTNVIDLVFMQYPSLSMTMATSSSPQKSQTQVMTCCLMAPSHYLTQCWLEIIGKHSRVISQKMFQICWQKSII